MQIGQKINGYRVLEFTKAKKKYFDKKYKKYRVYDMSMVKVICENCGDKKIIQPSLIHKTGCKQGPCHSKFINLKSKCFGHLKALKFVKTNNKHRKWRWLCLCKKCNKEFLISQCHLKHGQTACKGCTDKRRAKLRVLPNDAAKWNRVLKQYRNGAKNRNIKFKLSLEQVKNICLKECFYCRTSIRYDKLGLKRNGIDRIDNNKSYIIENIVPCCKICNHMKLDLTYLKFKKHISKVYKHINSKTFRCYSETMYTQAKNINHF